MIAGLLRDNLGFGLGLLIVKSSVTVGYILLAVAEPGVSDNLLYGWTIQYGSAASMFLFYLQLPRLFDMTSLTISALLLCMAFSTFIPELWKIMFLQFSFSPQKMSGIFAGMMGLSTIFSLLFMPWYNLESKDSFTTLIETVLMKIKY